MVAFTFLKVATISQVKQMFSQPIHLTHELILCIQIIRGWIDFNGRVHSKESSLSPSFELATFRLVLLPCLEGNLKAVESDQGQIKWQWPVFHRMTFVAAAAALVVKGKMTSQEDDLANFWFLRNQLAFLEFIWGRWVIWQLAKQLKP